MNRPQAEWEVEDEDDEKSCYVYHEILEPGQCAKHTLNTLLQRVDAFSSVKLARIAQYLDEQEAVFMEEASDNDNNNNKNNKNDDDSNNNSNKSKDDNDEDGRSSVSANSKDKNKSSNGGTSNDDIVDIDKSNNRIREKTELPTKGSVKNKDKMMIMSHNGAAGYDFSIQVVETALQQMGISCVNVHKLGEKVDVSAEEAFICNSGEHWKTLRKFPLGIGWINLDSWYDAPLFMSEKEVRESVLPLRSKRGHRGIVLALRGKKLPPAIVVDKKQQDASARSIMMMSMIGETGQHGQWFLAKERKKKKKNRFAAAAIMPKEPKWNKDDPRNNEEEARGKNEEPAKKVATLELIIGCANREYLLKQKRLLEDRRRAMYMRSRKDKKEIDLRVPHSVPPVLFGEVCFLFLFLLLFCFAVCSLCLFSFLCCLFSFFLSRSFSLLSLLTFDRYLFCLLCTFYLFFLFFLFFLLFFVSVLSFFSFFYFLSVFRTSLLFFLSLLFLSFL